MKFEDPFDYLNGKEPFTYKKKEVIYGPDDPVQGLYAVVRGKVKVFRAGEDGREMVIDIYREDEFFGECEFLGISCPTEQAVALEHTEVLVWSKREVINRIRRDARLAVALLQVLAKRSDGHLRRIDTHLNDKIPARLARCLIRFAKRLGAWQEDGSVRMMPFTHPFLANYVGTSREVITHSMNKFRRLHLLRYSTSETVVFPDAMRDWLRNQRRQPSG